ncbi:MAG: serine hydrolase, partial [Firmicutes bacterium]|nr:serine hydrolase [Bacillota bacterium]
SATNTWQVAPHPFAFASHSPAGSTPSGRARDLLAVVKMYLRLEHEHYLSDAIVNEAWSVQQPSCVSQLLTGWGLGWTILGWNNGAKLVGHDGATMGTNSFLRVHPESGTAIARLVNSSNGSLIYDEIFSVLSNDIIGTWEPGVPDTEPESADDLSQYQGIYSDVNGHVRLALVDGELEVSTVAEDGNHLPGSHGGKTILFSSGNGNFYTVGEVSKAFLSYPGEKTNLVAPYAVVTTDNGDSYFHNGYLGFKRVS